MPRRGAASFDPCSIDERNGPDQHSVGVFDVEWHTDKERVVPAYELVYIHADRPSIRNDFAAGAGRFFFTLEDRHSVVWVVELGEG